MRTHIVEIAAIGLAISVLFVTVAVDVSTAEAWRARLTGGLLLLIAAGGACVLAGRAAHPAHFRVYQPFDGGLAFVVLQAAGWAMFAVGLMMLLIFVSADAAPVRQRGVITAVGLVALAAVLTLLHSVQYYAHGSRAIHFHIVRRINAVPVTLQVGALFLAAGIEAPSPAFAPYRRSLAQVVWLVNSFALLAAVLRGLSTHGLGIFRPLSGGFDFVLLVSFGTAGCAVASFIFIVHYSAASSYTGMLFCLSFLHAFSTTLLLVAADRFSVADPAAVMLRLRASGRSVAPLAAAAGAWVLVAFCDLRANTCSAGIEGLAAAVVAVGPPLLHLATAWVRGYRAWMPFEGGFRFVVLQALAWFLYSVCLLLLGLSMLNDLRFLATAAAFFIIMAGVLVFVSAAFVEVVPPTPLEACSDSQPDLLNGEFTTSVLLSAGTVVLWYLDSSGSTAAIIHRYQIAAVAAACSLLGALLAHHSGVCLYPRAYRAFQPFVGGTDFMTVQAVAWTMWGLLLGVHCIIVLNLAVDGASISHGITGLITVLGLLLHLAMTASLTLFDPADSAMQRNAASARAKVSVSMGHALAADGDPDREARVLAELRRLAGSTTEPMAAELVASLASAVSASTRGQDPSGVITAGLSFATLLMFVNAEMTHHLLPAPRRALIAGGFFGIGCVSHALSCALVHLITGRRRIPGYRPWMPLEGGPRFILLQCVGWFLAVLAVYTAAVLGTAIVADSPLPTGALVMLGIVGQTACLMLLISTSHFVVTERLHGFVYRNGAWCVGLFTLFSAQMIPTVAGPILAASGLAALVPIVDRVSALFSLCTVPMGWVSWYAAASVRQRSDRPPTTALGAVLLLLVSTAGWGSPTAPGAAARVAAGVHHAACFMAILARERSGWAAALQLLIADTCATALHAVPIALLVANAYLLTRTPVMWVAAAIAAASPRWAPWSLPVVALAAIHGQCLVLLPMVAAAAALRVLPVPSQVLHLLHRRTAEHCGLEAVFIARRPTADEAPVVVCRAPLGPIMAWCAAYSALATVADRPSTFVDTALFRVPMAGDLLHALGAAPVDEALIRRAVSEKTPVFVAAHWLPSWAQDEQSGDLPIPLGVERLCRALRARCFVASVTTRPKPTASSPGHYLLRQLFVHWGIVTDTCPLLPPPAPMLIRISE